MKKIISAGGVVVLGNSILMLKKMNGDWVLPKGKVEPKESTEEAALREVKEEAGIKAMLVNYIGETRYQFKNYWSKNRVIDKRVHWYLMTALSTHPLPQRAEGFQEAMFIPMDKVMDMAKYDDEKEILAEAMHMLEG